MTFLASKIEFLPLMDGMFWPIMRSFLPRSKKVSLAMIVCSFKTGISGNGEERGVTGSPELGGEALGQGHETRKEGLDVDDRLRALL